MGQRSAPNILVDIDRTAREPLQKQIYAGIRGAILQGLVRPGTPIPSSRALADDLGVSRTTTLLALEQLQAEGYLETRAGSGTFVAAELPEDLPQVGSSARQAGRRHPPRLSRRGGSLAALPPPAFALGGPPRAFRIGTPGLDLFPVRLWSQIASRRLARVTASQLSYGEAAGLGVLREAIAEHVSTSRGTRCTADQVQVVPGAQRGLDLVCRLLLDAGDRAAVEDPGYPGVWTALVSAGAEIVPIRVDGEGLQVEALTARRDRVRLAYVTPSHQFPLGVPMSLARRLALLRWASAAGAWVVEDDYDSEFRYGEQPIPCLHGLDADGRVIYLGSFSKAVFPALRLGFLIVPSDLQERLSAVRRSIVEFVPSLDQAVLAEFIREGHFARHLRRMRAAYRERLEALASAARRSCAGALTVRPARTGLHAVADLHQADATAVFEEARARGIEVMPLAAYYMGRARPLNALVLGYASTPPDVIESGMEVLAEAIEAARRRSAVRRSGG